MVPKGRCNICYNDRIEVRPGYYACPSFYGSPMHWCDPYLFRDVPGDETGEMTAKRKLEEYCGCTLEEYLEAREKG